MLGHEGVVGLDLRGGAVALMEEGMGLIDHHDHQRPAWARAKVPGVGVAEDLGDAGLAVDHQPMDLPQYVTHVVQVVLGREPGACDQAVVVGAALAVDQHELHGR
jgi:hypothetical protein